MDAPMRIWPWPPGKNGAGTFVDSKPEDEHIAEFMGAYIRADTVEPLVAAAQMVRNGALFCLPELIHALHVFEKEMGICSGKETE